MAALVRDLLLAAFLTGALAGAADAASPAAASPDTAGGLTCPPNFLNETEQRMYGKEGAIRSGPWHIRCFQNGAGIYDRDHVYVFCQKNDTRASMEGADGHAIRFQFPPEIACVWER